MAVIEPCVFALALAPADSAFVFVVLACPFVVLAFAVAVFAALAFVFVVLAFFVADLVAVALAAVHIASVVLAGSSLLGFSEEVPAVTSPPAKIVR